MNSKTRLNIYWNTLVVNEKSITPDEKRILNSCPGFINSNSLYVLDSKEDIWKALAKGLNDKDFEALKALATDPRKSHITIRGMSDLNIPPFGTITNPNPAWLSFKSEGNEVWVEFKG